MPKSGDACSCSELSMDCNSPSFSVHGMSQAKILECGLLFPPPRRSSQPRDRTCISCIGRQILHHWVTWEAKVWHLHVSKWALVLVASMLLDLIAATWILILKSPHHLHPSLWFWMWVRFFFQKVLLDSSDSTWGLLASTPSVLCVCFHLSIYLSISCLCCLVLNPLWKRLTF